MRRIAKMRPGGSRLQQENQLRVKRRQPLIPAFSHHARSVLKYSRQQTEPAAFTAAFSHGALDTSEEGRQKSFADALKREIWLNPTRSRQRDEAARASANPMLFDALMHRQLYAVEQYCQHHLASAGALLAGQ